MTLDKARWQSRRSGPLASQKRRTQWRFEPRHDQRNVRAKWAALKPFFVLAWTEVVDVAGAKP